MRLIYILFFLIIIGTNTVKSQATLLASYDFTGGLSNDNSGNGNNGTLNGNPINGDTLDIGYNITDYLSLPSQVLNSSGFSIAFKVKFTSFNLTGANPTNQIFSTDNPSLTDVFEFSYEKDISKWRVGFGNVTACDFPDNTIIAGKWYCVVLTRNNAGWLKLYVDGIQNATTYSYPSPLSITSFIFGQETDCFASCFAANQSANAKFDDLKFYDDDIGVAVVNTICGSPIPTASFTANQQTICVNQTIQFNNTSTNATNYTWNFGDGSMSVLQNPSHTYSVSGNYTVNLTATNGSSNSSYTTTITVNPTPTLNINGNTQICLGNSTTLTANTNANSIIWNTGNTNPTIIVSPTASVYYNVSTLGNCPAKDSIFIDVLNFSSADFSFYKTDSCKQAIQINSVNNTAPNYWLLGDGNTTSNNYSFSYQYPHSGNYTVTCITNPNTSCADTAVKSISILNSATINNLDIPNVFTPNGDGINDIFDLSTLRICSEIEFEIFNRWGIPVFKSQAGKTFWDGKIEGGIDSPDGTYYYLLKIDVNRYNGMVSLFR